MAIRFEDVPLPLVEGQEGGYDQALVPPPKVLSIENGEFDTRGNIKAIDTTNPMTVSVMTGEDSPSNTNPEVRKLYSHKETLLVETWEGILRAQQETSLTSGLFALASSPGRGDVPRRAHVGATSIPETFGTSADILVRPLKVGTSGMDAAALGNYYLTAWTESFYTGGAETFQIGWQIRHKDGDRPVASGRIVSITPGGDAFEPRCVVFDNLFHIFFNDNTDSVRRLTIEPTESVDVSETGTIVLAPGPAILDFDVIVNPSGADFAVAISTVTPELVISVRSTTSPYSETGSATLALADTTSHIGMMWIPDGALGAFHEAYTVFFVDATSLATLQWFGVDVTGTSLGSGSQALTGITEIERIYPLREYNTNANSYPVFMTTRTAATIRDLDSRVVCFDAENGVLLYTGAVEIVAPGVIAGHPTFLGGSLGTSYGGQVGSGLLLPTQIASEEQFTYVIYDVTLPVRTFVQTGTTEVLPWAVLRVFDAGNFAQEFLQGSFGRVPPLIPHPDGNNLKAHSWCAKFTPNITDALSIGSNPTNIQRNTIDYAANLKSTEFAGLTYIPGGVPLVFDGRDIVEEGFTEVPEIISAVAAGGGGPLSAGSYQVVAVFERFDAQGNRWQSGVSSVETFTAVAGNTYTLSVTSVPRTLQQSGVRVVPYRTAAGGTIFYRDVSPSSGMTPLTDAQLQTGELLYTGGVTTFLGTQSNNALPAVESFTEHEGRLVAVGGEHQTGFFYSKVRSDRFPAEFNRASGFGQVSDSVGTLHAAASMDGKLVLFGEASLAVLFGKGPNANWVQNDFDTPSLLLATEGIDPDSPHIALTADGAWYMSVSGPRMLTRSLTTAEGPDGRALGDEVRNLAQGRLTSCKFLMAHPHKTQVWFMSAGDVLCYVYDTKFKKWTTRADFLEVGGTVTTALHHTPGRVWMLNQDIWADDPLRYETRGAASSSALVPLRVTTGWWSLAGVQKFQRISHIQVRGANGEFADEASNLAVSLQVVTPDGSNTTSLNVTPGANANDPWECEFQMIRQTHTRFKFIITVTPSTWGGNFTLSALLARVGLKSGGARLASSARG